MIYANLSIVMENIRMTTKYYIDLFFIVYSLSTSLKNSIYNDTVYCYVFRIGVEYVVIVDCPMTAQLMHNGFLSSYLMQFRHVEISEMELNRVKNENVKANKLDFFVKV